MKRYTVTYTDIIERYITCTVLADSEEEAIENVKNGIFEDDDSDVAPEDCIESKDHNVINEEEL